MAVMTDDPRPDPRPDLTGDAPLWARLLDAAWRHDGNDADGCYQLLRGIRSEGIRLRQGVTTLILDHPDGGDGAAVWADMRARWIGPRADQLKALMREAA